MKALQSRFVRLAWPLVMIALGVALSSPRANAWQMLQPPLSTQWTSQVNTNTPLPEYPRPQLVRSHWLNLNGIWQFQPGTNSSDPVPTNHTLASSILVPFPMESAISGVMQYSAWSWYRRTFTIPTNWPGQHVILHLDAVTWQTTVYVNGKDVGTHKGGYDPFSYDITGYLNGGTNELILRVYSPEDNGGQPRGKQTLYPGGIMYTSSSGVWQPAWLEPVDAAGAQDILLVPDIDHSRLAVTVHPYGGTAVTVNAQAYAGTNLVGSASGASGTAFYVPITNQQLWSPSNPFLYSLQISLVHNAVTNDTLSSYFGMRKISTNFVNGVPLIYLNNQPVFGMGPLDQGYWPDGIYTAPTDEALAFDIKETKALGFNTIRKHEKVERQRWYYWADVIGLMIWQDMPTCNSYTGAANPPAVDPVQFTAELSALVTNHINSPCIIMWDVFNEDQGEQGSGDGVGQTNTAYLVGVVNTLDPSRLVNEASGGAYFGVGNVYDNHNYPPPGDPTSSTQANVDGEYGGIGNLVQGHLWNPSQASPAYINEPTGADINPLYDEYSDELVSYKAGGLNAAIYTQITDVENECDGLLTYDRAVVKPDPAQIAYSNEKAITGYYNTTTIIPTSQVTPQTWKYTINTNTASQNWYATNFNDSTWSTGLAGFGTTDPGVTPNTSWTTTGYIWLRRTFNPGNLTPQEISNLTFSVYHDEDVVIYINGVLAAQASGYSSTYIPLAMSAEAQAAIIPNGTNVMAVSCYQTTGGQFIDVGINSQILIANTFTIPTDVAGDWNLNETNGSIAYDSSGNGDNGTINGPALWDVNGKLGGCLSFNGSNNFVRINRDVTNDFSLVFWFQTTATGGSGTWRNGLGLVDGSMGAGNTDFGASIISNRLAFGVGDPDTTLLSTNAVNDGAWHLCAATRAQSTGLMSLYVDGVLQASAAGSSNTLSGPPSINFGRIETGSGYFTGNLDEIKIFDRALGNLEIAALYADESAPPPAPSNLTASIGRSSVALNWSSSPAATGYIVARSQTSGGPFTIIATIDTEQFTDANVVDGVTYYYVVAGVDSDGVGAYSSEVAARPVNLVAWFAADSLTNLANGASISNWPDLSGEGNNATQPTASARPTLLDNAISGLPVVHFNSANSNYLSFARPVQDDFTIAFVFRSKQGSGTSTWYYNGEGLVNGEVPNVINDFGTSLNTNGQICAGTGQPDTAIYSGNGNNDGNPHLAVFERTEGTGNIVLYVDGVLVSSATGGTESLTAPPVLTIGCIQTLIGFLTGDMAEIRIYNSVFTNAQLTSLENTLADKWGIDAIPAPSQVTASASAVSVTVNWSNVAGASGYIVSRGGSASGPFSAIASAAAGPIVDTNVSPGSTYWYTVAATNAIYVSANSAPVYASVSLAGTLVAWFEADRITNAVNGSAVSNWPDISGFGCNAIQTNAAYQPVYVTGAMNGSPVVRFIAAQYTDLTFARPVANDFTAMLVFQSTQGLGHNPWYYQGAGLLNGQEPGYGNDFGISLTADGQIAAGTGNPDVSIASAFGYNDGNPHVVTFERAQSTGALALLVDGFLAATGTGGTNALNVPNLTLGSIESLLGYFSGDLAEVRLYNSLLPAATRQSIESSLRGKYVAASSATLSAANSGNGAMTLSWPTQSGLSLYYATNLAPPTTWLPVPIAPTLANETSSVTIFTTNAAEYFHLSR